MSDVARILKEARDQGRLTALDFAQGIFDDFIELHGDRNFRDDGAIIGGIGRLNGQAVTVVGIQKGRNLQDNLNRNFGQPHPEGYRKALRLMKQAEKFGRPVVTFINTAGAYPLATASPMSGRLARSRLPPQPNTVTIRLKPAPRSALRTLINASGVCA